MTTTARPQGMPHLWRTPRASDSLCAPFDLGNSQALSCFPMFFFPHLPFSLFCLYSVSSLHSQKKKKPPTSTSPPPPNTPPYYFSFFFLSPSTIINPRPPP